MLAKRLRLTELVFGICPKYYKNLTFERLYEIYIDTEISRMFKNLKPIKDKKLKVIITGDFDEKEDSVLEIIQDTADKIKEKFKNDKKIISCKIFEKRKQFKIEAIMAAIVDEKKIYKKLLREKLNTEHPNIEDLLKYYGINKKQAIRNLENSSHPLFEEIFKCKK